MGSHLAGQEMNIVMAGIDHTLAGVAQREVFAFSSSRQARLYQQLIQQEGVRGAVLMCTCNRTELYLSLEVGLETDPFDLLCDLAGLGGDHRQFPHILRRGPEVFRHLGRLASGAKSRIRGEDQIIAQVRRALECAREQGGADTYLEVMFRRALTAAKEVRTRVRFSSAGDSVARRTLQFLDSREDRDARVLVIGNGEIGRLTARTLLAEGYQVTVTLRSHTCGLSGFPRGAETIGYGDRYRMLSGFNVVISATASPHLTICPEKLQQLGWTGLLIDLALPRDIGAEAACLPGVTLVDIDEIAGPEVESDHRRQGQQMDVLIEKHWQKLLTWMQGRQQRVGGARGA